MTDHRFTKDALRRVDGAVVPLTMYSDGARLVVGEATLHFVENKGLKADIFVDDELVKTWFKEKRLE